MSKRKDYRRRKRLLNNANKSGTRQKIEISADAQNGENGTLEAKASEHEQVQIESMQDEQANEQARVESMQDEQVGSEEEEKEDMSEEEEKEGVSEEQEAVEG